MHMDAKASGRVSVCLFVFALFSCIDIPKYDKLFRHNMFI